MPKDFIGNNLKEDDEFGAFPCLADIRAEELYVMINESKESPIEKIAQLKEALMWAHGRGKNERTDR